MPVNKTVRLYIVSVTLALGVMAAASVACAGMFDNMTLPGKDASGDQEEFKAADSVELQADKVGFAQGENKAKAEGNVVVTSGQEQLFCDTLDLDRTKQEATATGHVYLDSPNQQVDADTARYNFSTQTGSFTNARVFNEPFQIKGPRIEKITQTHYGMDNGFMTTCDHDKPHFRLQARRMDVYQGDKAVARRVKMFLGRVPVMYMPRYTQDLKNKPWFTFMPGHDKDLGYFLLTRSRIYSTDRLTSTVRLDLYERQGIGWGMDNKYETQKYGSGIVRHYFINERAIGNKHPWKEKTISSVNNERYKLEWRHKWDIDKQTNAIWQYYRLSDDVLLKKYFEKEYRRDASTNTYFLLSRALPYGNASFRVDQRVNRFTSAVDRMPEIKFENSGQEIAETGFYIKTATTYSNLVSRAASPTEDRKKTQRLDTDNELYYPMKIAFIEARPFVGGEHTYYSRAIDPQRNNSLRGIFRTGADLSTKFYRVWNIKKDFPGMKIDRLRHVVTPTVAYISRHRSTLTQSYFNQFDGIDNVARSHKFGLGLENKLQTKRNKETVDLLRTLVSSDFALKENPGQGGFGPVNSDVEFKPNDWLTFNADASYDHKQDYFTTVNFETYINGGDKWSFGLGRRYTRDADDQITTEWAYKVNSKWKFKIYERFTLNSGVLKEEDYVLTRDLHEWEVDILYHQLRGTGSEFLVVFRLKAFPDMGLDLFGTSFNKRKAGSQSGQ